MSNDWTDWRQIWYTSADSSGNGHRLNTIRPSTLGGGGLGGHKFKNQGHSGGGVDRGVTNSKILGSCQKAGPICTKFGTPLWIHLGMDIG